MGKHVKRLKMVVLSNSFQGILVRGLNKAQGPQDKAQKLKVKDRKN